MPYFYTVFLWASDRATNILILCIILVSHYYISGNDWYSQNQGLELNGHCPLRDSPCKFLWANTPMQLKSRIPAPHFPTQEYLPQIMEINTCSSMYENKSNRSRTASWLKQPSRVCKRDGLLISSWFCITISIIIYCSSSFAKRYWS